MMGVSIIAYFAKKKKPLTIQEICSHQQLQCNLRGDGKFWNLSTAVGVSYFVHEISTHFGQHMGTIINNRELRVCPCQLNHTKPCHLTKMVLRSGKLSFDSSSYLFWTSSECVRKCTICTFPKRLTPHFDG